MSRPSSPPPPPRTLLLPVPHAVADQLHHLLQHHSQELLAQENIAAVQFQYLADTLDHLARQAGVIGW